MSIYNEIGRVGQNRWNGFISEEFLKELQGNRGIEIYKEMSSNDSVIGAILFAIEMMIRQVKWTVMPAAETKIDREAAEFIESCMDDMSQTWTDTISEILSFLTFGWSAHELVYKRRTGRKKDPSKSSAYNDNLIGWAKLPIRAQESLYEWVFEDDTDNLIGMRQMPAPDYKLVEIPIDRLLLFRTMSAKDNPEGRSVLRTCYRDWYFKKRIQEIEGIGIERDLAGLPVLKAPEGVQIWDVEDAESVALYTAASAIVKNIKRDSQEGIVIPYDWDLTLLSTGGRRNFDTNQIIERYDSRIAMTVLADFIMLGHQAVGSFALSSDKTELFSVALGTFLDIIAEEFNNKAIPTLLQLNSPKFDKITDWPWLEPTDVETPNLEELSKFLRGMVGAQILTPGPNLEKYVREAASLPEEDEAYLRQMEEQRAAETAANGQPGPNPGQPGSGHQSTALNTDKPEEKALDKPQKASRVGRLKKPDSVTQPKPATDEESIDTAGQV